MMRGARCTWAFVSTPNAQPPTPTFNRDDVATIGSWGVGNWELTKPSVQNALDEPVIRLTLAEDTVGGAVAQRDVPLVAVPIGGMGQIRRMGTMGNVLPIRPSSPSGVPPTARRPPRSRARLHTSTGQPASLGDDAH